MPHRAVAAQALADWRAADQRMSECDLGSAEWIDACRTAEAAKQRYQEAFDAARRAKLAEPPPFEDASRADAART